MASRTPIRLNGVPLPPQMIAAEAQHHPSRNPAMAYQAAARDIIIRTLLLEEAQREGIRSILVLPLCVRSVSIGVLRLYSGQVRRFSAEELAFAAAIADLGAVAIENAKLHEVLKSRLEGLKEDSNGWFRFLAFS